VGRQVANGVISPVVSQPPVHQVPVVDKVMDGHQLYCVDPQAGQIINYGRAGKSCVGAAQFLRHFRMSHGKSAHVHLVDHRL
jgi:hypothetical protein